MKQIRVHCLLLGLVGLARLTYGFAVQPPEPTAQDASGSSSTAVTQRAESKGERKLKGCIASENGKLVLEENGKNVALTGTDLSAHNGHRVILHGTWENDSSTRKFNVTSVDMVSETCRPGGPGIGPNPPPPPPPPPPKDRPKG